MLKSSKAGGSDDPKGASFLLHSPAAWLEPAQHMPLTTPEKLRQGNQDCVMHLLGDSEVI